MSEMSISDMLSIAGGNNGNSWVWLLVLLFLFLGGNGFSRNGFGDAATAASQQEILYNQKFDSLGRMINQTADGISSSTFALNDKISSLGAQIDGQTAAITQAIVNEGNLTRGMIQQNEIQALRDKVQSLEMANAMNGVVRYPSAMTYALPQNPFCGSSCGCQ